MKSYLYGILSYKTGICICLCSFLYPDFCKAQERGAQELSAGFIFSEQTIKDKGMSALIYKGFYPGVALGLNINGSDLKHRLAFNFSAGKLQDKNELNSADGKRFRLRYTGLISLSNRNHENKLQLYLGAFFDNDLNIRKQNQYTNNQHYYEFNSSIGPAIKVTYNFGKAGSNHLFVDYRLSSTFFSPLLNALSRSNSIHNRVNDFTSPSFKTYVKNVNLVTVNRYIRFNWQTQLQRKISQKSSLSIGYQWDHYQIKEVNSVQSASHTAAINYIFSL